MESWDTHWQGPYWDVYTYGTGKLSGYVNTGSQHVRVSQALTLV